MESLKIKVFEKEKLIEARNSNLNQTERTTYYVHTGIIEFVIRAMKAIAAIVGTLEKISNRGEE